MIAKAILGGLGGGMKSLGDSSKTSLSRIEKKETSGSGKEIGALLGKGVKALSDEDIKSIYPDMSDEMIQWFSQINPIKFTYKEEAQELYKDEGKGVDDNEHIGVKAQELEKNPITAGTVETDEHGFKEVDTRHLAFADTAMISELCRKIIEIEKKLSLLEGVLNKEI